MDHNLYVKYKTITFREGNIRENLDNPGYSNGFSDKTRIHKKITDKLNYIKI